MARSRDQPLEDLIAKLKEQELPKTIRFCEGLEREGEIISKRAFWDDECWWFKKEESTLKIKLAIEALGYIHFSEQPVPTGYGGIWWNSWYRKEGEEGDIEEFPPPEKPVEERVREDEAQYETGDTDEEVEKAKEPQGVRVDP